MILPLMILHKWEPHRAGEASWNVFDRKDAKNTKEEADCGEGKDFLDRITGLTGFRNGNHVHPVILSKVFLQSLDEMGKTPIQRLGSDR